MPCSSDHMEQSAREAAIQHAAQVLIDVLELLDCPVPLHVRAADTYYARDTWIIPALCRRLEDLSPGALDELLYSDARDQRRRAIADWWEKHLAVDVKRQADVAERRVRQANRQALRDSAWDKLTPEERVALGLQ